MRTNGLAIPRFRFELRLKTEFEESSAARLYKPCMKTLRVPRERVNKIERRRFMLQHKLRSLFVIFNVSWMELYFLLLFSSRITKIISFLIHYWLRVLSNVIILLIELIFWINAILLHLKKFNCFWNFKNHSRPTKSDARPPKKS